MLTITPRPAGSMWRAAAWAQRNVPVRLTASVRDQTSRSSSSRGRDRADAGVVDEDVEATVLGDDGVEQRGDLLGIGDVGHPRRGDPARGAQARGGGAGELLVEVGDHDARALRRQLVGDRRAEAASRSRDHRDPPVEHRALLPHRGRRGRRATASSIRPVTAPTVVILAAGQGTRMRSRTPKVLHDLCGRPMIAWPVAAALAAGAGKVVVVDGPAAAARRAPARRASSSRSSPSPTGPAAPCRRRPRSSATTTVLVLNGDVPLVTAEALAALARGARGRRRPGDGGLDGARRPHRLRARRAQRRRLASRAWWRRRSPATRPPEELAIHEVNAGVYAFDGAALHARPRAPDARQRPGRALPARGARAARPRRRAPRSTTPRCCSASTTASTSPRVRALAQARIHARAHARRGHDRRPRQHADRRRRRDRRRHGDRARRRFLRGATTIGERCTVGPLTTLIDTALGDEVPRAALLPRRVRGAHRRERRAVRLPAPGRAAARAREGRHLRRDQELRHRRGHQGAAPELHRRRRRRARTPTSAPRPSPPTTTARHKHRTTIGANVRTSVDSTLVAPVTIGDGAYVARELRDHRGRAAGRSRHRARAPDQHRGLRRAQASSARRRTHRRDPRVD